MILQLATEDNVTLPSYEVTGENFASNGENAQEFIQPQNQFNDNETAIRAAALASRTNAANGCFSLCSMAGMGTKFVFTSDCSLASWLSVQLIVQLRV